MAEEINTYRIPIRSLSRLTNDQISYLIFIMGNRILSTPENHLKRGPAFTTEDLDELSDDELILKALLLERENRQRKAEIKELKRRLAERIADGHLVMELFRRS